MRYIFKNTLLHFLTALLIENTEHIFSCYNFEKSVFLTTKICYYLYNEFYSRCHIYTTYRACYGVYKYITKSGSSKWKNSVALVKSLIFRNRKWFCFKIECFGKMLLFSKECIGRGFFYIKYQWFFIGKIEHNIYNIICFDRMKSLVIV